MLPISTISAGQLITHDESSKFDLNNYYERLAKIKNLSLPLEAEINLLNRLSEFELGRFLLENKGLNGYWTSYIILHAPSLSI